MFLFLLLLDVWSNCVLFVTWLQILCHAVQVCIAFGLNFSLCFWDLCENGLQLKSTHVVDWNQRSVDSYQLHLMIFNNSKHFYTSWHKTLSFENEHDITVLKPLKATIKYKATKDNNVTIMYNWTPNVISCLIVTSHLSFQFYFYLLFIMKYVNF